MIIYLVRHGQDDCSVRGGWSASPLTDEGVRQSHALAQEIIRRRTELNIRRILSSDLPRALQTAQPTADVLALPVEPHSGFREVNNGELAGMKNDLALVRYPGLFWNTLNWDEPYPGGESPRAFKERIEREWRLLSEELVAKNENALLFTHSGVIHVIRHLLTGTHYSNADRQPAVPHAALIPAEYIGGTWRI